MKCQKKIETLIDLGLTVRQARVYLALFRLGQSTTQQISKESKVGREDLYRVLSALEDLSLAEKVVSSPATFRAIPIGFALEILYKRKSDRLSELQEKIKDLQATEEKSKSTNPDKNTSEYILIPKKETVILRRRNAIINASMTIDVVNTWKRHMQAKYHYHEAAKRALQRGVRVRVVVDKPKDTRQLKIMTELKRFSNFEIKYLAIPPTALLSIYDRKEAFVAAIPETPLGDSPAFWTNNPCLLTIAQGYFESIWSKSIGEKECVLTSSIA